MTDLFPALALGEILDRERAQVLECEVVTAAVTKGQIVGLTHVASGLPKVTPAADVSAIAKGVVMAYCDGGTGLVGESVLIAWHCAAKVAIGDAGMTAGKMIIIGNSGTALGTVEDGTIVGLVIGRALQSGNCGDTGLVWLD